MTELKKLDYVERGPHGTILKLYCKCCGRIIAFGMGSTIKRVPEYMEIKIMFDDGAPHVTNICKPCAMDAGAEDKRQMLLDMFNADMDFLALDVPRLAEMKRRPEDGLPRMVEMMVGNQGIP